MPATHNITQVIPRMRDGDEQAAEIIWREYFGRLVRYARRKLDGVPRRAVDEEDVALSAMFSFCRGMEAGRFEKVDDREDLWKLLVTITARKACGKRRHEFAGKRDARRTRDEGAFVRLDGSQERNVGIEVLAVEPTPELADMVVASCHELLDCLDEKGRLVAIWTLEGHSTSEIALKLGCVNRTVQRKLERIRDKWSRMGLAPKPK